MPGNVSLTMAVPADEPLLIKPVGMLGNALRGLPFHMQSVALSSSHRTVCIVQQTLFFLLHHLYEIRWRFDYTFDIYF